MNHKTNREVEGNIMADFIKKPVVQLIMQGGFMGVLILVLYMNYKQTDKFMDIYETQSKESTASQVELAKTLQSLTDAVKHQ